MHPLTVLSFFAAILTTFPVLGIAYYAQKKPCDLSTHTIIKTERGSYCVSRALLNGQAQTLPE